MRSRPLKFLVAVCLLLLAVVSPRARTETTPPPRPAPPPLDFGELWQTKYAVDQKLWNDVIAWHEASRPKLEGNVGAQRRQESREARYGTGACGGDLPPCSVLACESGGDLNAHNASGADGKWQIMSNDGGVNTWATTDTDGDKVADAYVGPDGTAYDNPSDAPEEVQDARAREIYAGGRGRAQWVC